MESLTPNLFVKDINATLDFYSRLGFQLAMSVPEQGERRPNGPLVWAMMTNGKVTIMFQTIESLGDTLPAIHRTDGGSLLLYINLTDIRSFFESIKDKVTVLKGLERTFYGATEFSILDNNNYVLTFAEHE
ncbi:MAG TPA: VOC family protein [Puia sp.]|uniref:VOC family protein n=1 Tax=Puia sp. TaxID=2045100 RepID=UPI002BAA6862|nr:VOC family protein [Puia sp.]HVU94972.1 VOC family protein [Puia sp.]